MLFEMATQYANDVLDGKEEANKYVKKQCKIFLDDLERQHDESLLTTLILSKLERWKVYLPFLTLPQESA